VKASIFFAHRIGFIKGKKIGKPREFWIPNIALRSVLHNVGAVKTKKIKSVRHEKSVYCSLKYLGVS